MRILFCLCIMMSFPAIAGPKAIGTIGGRFQIVQVSEYRRDQFLIDSETGRLWRFVCSRADAGSSANCDIGSWQPESVIGISVSEKEYRKQVGQYDAENAKPTREQMVKELSKSGFDPDEYLKKLKEKETKPESATAHPGSSSP